MNYPKIALPGILVLVWGIGLLINPCSAIGCEPYDESLIFKGEAGEPGLFLAAAAGEVFGLDVLMQEAKSLASLTYVPSDQNQGVSQFEYIRSTIGSSMTHRAGHAMRFDRTLMSRTFGILRTT